MVRRTYLFFNFIPCLKCIRIKDLTIHNTCTNIALHIARYDDDDYNGDDDDDNNKNNDKPNTLNG